MIMKIVRRIEGTVISFSFTEGKARSSSWLSRCWWSNEDESFGRRSKSFGNDFDKTHVYFNPKESAK